MNGTPTPTRLGRIVAGVVSLGMVALGAFPTAAAATAAAHPARPVPAGFLARSTSWPDPSTGWVLGSAQCATGQCTTVITTRDAGHTWSEVGAVPAPVAAPGMPGVTQVRFADSWYGWAYGPSLYATRDGGHTWRHAALPGSGRQVVGLAAQFGVVYIAVSPCAIGQPQYECSAPTTLWRASTWWRGWHKLPVKLPVTTGTGAVTIALRGPSVYVAAGGNTRPEALHASLTGFDWSSRPSPCDTSIAAGITDIVALPDRIAVLCVGGIGLSRSTKNLYLSYDSGRTYHYLGTAPSFGIASALTATPSGSFVISSSSAGNWLYFSASGKTWSTVLAHAGYGWNNLQFTTDHTGYVVDETRLANVGQGSLLTTHDGGLHWTAVVLGPAAARPGTSRTTKQMIQGDFARWFDRVCEPLYVRRSSPMMFASECAAGAAARRR